MKFPTKKSSPARATLAEAISARREAEEKLAAIQSSLARIAQHESAVAESERDLAALDAAEASATLAWSKANDGEAPAPDVERRDAINRALSVARSQARAAAAARSSLEAESIAAASALPGIQAWTNVAIAQIIVEESAPAIADLRDAQRLLAAKKERVKQAFEFVRATAETMARGSKESQTAFAAMAELAHDMELAFLIQPWCSIGSDGSALAVDGTLRRGHPHPRSFGTFPRVLGEYVRNRKRLRLEDAVRKMTSVNAAKAGLFDRGLLRLGQHADVVIFDPASVTDHSTYVEPFQYSTGIIHVLINGKFVLDQGQTVNTRPGRALRHGRSSSTGEIPNHRGK